MMLRFEDKVYIKQWLNFRRPTLKDMTEVNGRYIIDCGICLLSLNTSIK